MITHGHAVGMVESDGTLVATALVLPFEARIGWISMVLVTPARRRQGLATRLLHHCLTHCDNAGMTPILDATDAGRQVYTRLGFTACYAIRRWERTPSAEAATPVSFDAVPAIRPLTPADLDGLATWDRARFGANRAPVLHHCRQAAPHLAYIAEKAGGTPTGYLLGRSGHRATQLGPLVTDDEAVARRLLQAALAKATGRVYIDVPETQTAFERELAEAGFTKQRGLMRMVKGTASPLPPPDAIYAIAGPELG